MRTAYQKAIEYYGEAIKGSRELGLDKRVEVYIDKLKRKFDDNPELVITFNDFYEDLNLYSGPWTPKSYEEIGGSFERIKKKGDKLAAKNCITLQEAVQLIKLGDECWNIGRNGDAYDHYTQALRAVEVVDEQFDTLLQLLSMDKYSHINTSLLEPQGLKKVSFVEMVNKEGKPPQNMR